jgi:hypothetical protein
MSQVIGNSFQLKLDQFTKEIENLQNKCICRSDVRQSDLSTLSTILQNFSMIGSNLVDRKFVVEENSQKSVERALMAILCFQHLMPNQLDTKVISEMFGRLFSVLSAEINKLESVDNKLARHKRFKRIIEKSEKSKQAGK